MKRKLLMALVCALALCWLCGAALGESKTEYGRQIGASLDALQIALASQDKRAANSALAQVRSSVYAAVRYLAQIGEYDSRAMEIVNNANQAYTAAFGGDGNYASYMSQARAYNTQVFGDSGYSDIDPETGSPFIKHVHRSSELEIIEPATCDSEGLASGICDAGVNWYGIAETAYSLDHGYEKSAPCGAYFTCETEIDPNNHAGGTAIQGQNIVCLGCGAVLAVSSSDLGQFLTSVTITSVPGNNNDNYDIELEFAETEALQFDNDVSLLYTFPAGITIPEDSNTQTAISFSADGTTYVVSGNAVQVDTSGNMTVNFNDSDPNFERLAEAANICFQVSIHAQISEAYHEIDWNGGREGQEITVTYVDPVYTVTLDPGEGTGEPITYYSTSQSEIPGWHDAQNCQFYYEDDGSLAFRLVDDYCPDTFSGPSAFYRFDGWENNIHYNKLSARQTTFTAKWLINWDAVPDASYTLSAQPVTLQGAGYTPFSITAETLVFGKYVNENGNYTIAEQLGVNLFQGTLNDGNGNSISCIPCHADQTYDTFWPTIEIFTSQGQQLDLFIYMDPESFEAAVPGTYAGTLGINVSWAAYGLGFNVDYTIPLTLVVPEHPYAITTDGAARGYYYDDSSEQVFPTEAAEGTALSLMLDDNAVPEEGNYFTGEFTVNGVSLGREYSEDGLTSWPVTGFSMPAEAVTIGAVKAARETLALTFAPGETRALPVDAWMQLQYYETAVGEPPLLRYDEATGTEALDVNRDGKPDLQIAFDDEAYCVNLTRMPACAAFGAFSFAFTGPIDRYGTVAFTLPAPAFGPAAFTLPAALTTIEESAFEGNIALTVVEAGEGVTAIGADAFKGCANLTQIKLPANCAIDPAAFTGCGTVYVFAPSGGTTEAFCQNPNVDCVFVETQD